MSRRSKFLSFKWDSFPNAQKSWSKKNVAPLSDDAAESKKPKKSVGTKGKASPGMRSSLAETPRI